MANDLVTVTMSGSGRGQGQTAIRLAKGADPRLLVMMAHDLLVAAETQGVLTEAVSTARPLLEIQVQLWGVRGTPKVSQGGSGGEGSNGYPHPWVG